MSAITTGGKLVHYEVLGRGRPVILLHSWVGSWRYWIPTMQSLQNKYRVYAIDLYGFGDSAKDPAHYSVEQQIALLDDFMLHLGLPKAALIGHGLGALVATEFARRHPDRVARLLIANGPLYDPGDLEHRVPAGQPRRQPVRPPLPEAEAGTTITNAASAAMRAAMLEAARARGLPLLGDSRPDFMPNPPSKRNPLQALVNNAPDALLAKCFRKSEPSYDKLNVDVAKVDPPALRKSAEGFDAGRLLDTLRLLALPVVIVHGGDDPLVPQPNEEILNYITLEKENTLLPILLPNVRHFPMLEDDRFIRLANEFLEAPDISKLEIKERWRRRTR